MERIAPALALQATVGAYAPLTTASDETRACRVGASGRLHETTAFRPIQEREGASADALAIHRKAAVSLLQDWRCQSRSTP
jgi:hypothetical protein